MLDAPFKVRVFAFETQLKLYCNDRSMIDLGTLGGVESAASAINDGGQIAGSSQPSGSTDFHAFVYTAGTMTDISPSAAARQQALTTAATWSAGSPQPPRQPASMRSAIAAPR